MALLLTSNSLARSLIRTLLIRPFLYSAFALSLHRGLTE
jgi:ABC-type sugar transport system permease subunit